MRWEERAGVLDGLENRDTETEAGLCSRCSEEPLARGALDLALK